MQVLEPIIFSPLTICYIAIHPKNAFITFFSVSVRVNGFLSNHTVKKQKRRSRISYTNGGYFSYTKFGNLGKDFLEKIGVKNWCLKKLVSQNGFLITAENAVVGLSWYKYNYFCIVLTNERSGNFLSCFHDLDFNDFQKSKLGSWKTI